MQKYKEIVDELLSILKENQTEDINTIINLITDKYNLSAKSKEDIISLKNHLVSYETIAKERAEYETRSELIQKRLLKLMDKEKTLHLKDNQGIVDTILGLIIKYINKNKK